jgi:5-aminopentanamidase
VSPAPLRVAAAQAESVSGDVETNVATAVRLVREAAVSGAGLVVLPELFLTGYHPAGWVAESFVTVGDPRLEPLAGAAARTGAVVLAGAALHDGDQRPTISLLAFDGAVSHVYDKQHLFDEERSVFAPGRHGSTISLHGWEIGLGICYDGCFPEHARAAAADGAQVYVCPSAYYTGTTHRRDLYYAARALDNGIYVVFSGLAGRCGDRDFNGGSAVYDPEGRVVVRLDEAPGIACADLDPAEVDRARKANPLLEQRLNHLGARQRFTL